VLSGGRQWPAERVPSAWRRLHLPRSSRGGAVASGAAHASRAGGGRGAARRAQDAKLNAGGLLGGCTLEYLRLAAVLQAGEPVLSLLRGIWFGLW
jgi:hypothetical protein